MDALLVNGDEIELTPDPPWRWMAPPVKSKVSALPAHRIKATGESAIWESEILMASLLGAGQMYAAPGFDTPAMRSVAELNTSGSEQPVWISEDGCEIFIVRQASESWKVLVAQCPP